MAVNKVSSHNSKENHLIDPKKEAKSLEEDFSSIQSRNHVLLLEDFCGVELKEERQKD